MKMQRIGPPGLPMAVVDRLLDLLSEDDAFHALFEADTVAALKFVGYVPADNMEMSPAWCLATTNLASKEDIRRERAKLAITLNAINGFDSPLGVQQDKRSSDGVR